MASPRPFLLALTSTLFASSVVAQTETPEFARDVLPIFETSCTICHGAELTESQLRLDSEAAVLEGGVSGAVVSPGDSEASVLLRRLTGEDVPRMPVGGDPLSADVEPLSETDPRLSVSLQFTRGDVASEPVLLLTRVAPHIAWLDLKGRTLSAAEWSELARFENLERLHLEQTNVEDAHLEPLSAASGLEYVNLYDTEIGDAGLAHLSGLGALKEVYLWESNVSDGAVARFLEDNPTVRVQRGIVR